VRDTVKAMTIVKMAYEQGVFITPVIAPAVPEKDVLIRFALMATHTKEQVDRAVDVLTGIFKELEIIA
jgi:8-amino-7-oxononanoate synthase